MDFERLLLRQTIQKQNILNIAVPFRNYHKKNLSHNEHQNYSSSLTGLITNDKSTCSSPLRSENDICSSQF